MQARDKAGRTDIAVVRLEELAPFPQEHIQQELSKYYAASEYVWVQEEHENQGAYSFVLPRFQQFVRASVALMSVCGG